MSIIKHLLLIFFCLCAGVLYAQQETETDAPSPYYYRLVGAPTFYRDAIHDTFTLTPKRETNLNDEINKALVQLYIRRPDLIRHHDLQFQDEAVRTPEQQNITNDVEQALSTLNGQSVNGQLIDIDDIGLQIQRPNFWKVKGTFALRFTQNYFSDNWYKGGDNSLTLLSSLLLEATYDDQRRITWENRLDMRLGFVASRADTCHNYITNNDKLNLYSKLGVKAARSWYYTASVEANTQFLPGYRVNDTRTWSKFCAPLDFYASLGMDFKPKLKNGNELSVALLPLSYKFRYLRSDEENIHRSYKMEGEDFHQDFGAKVEVNAKMKLAKDLLWKCRCYYFTSYKYTEAELENTLQYNLSRYIAAELFTLWRFDDNRSPDFYDDNLGYFQFKEYFTLGLTYNF